MDKETNNTQPMTEACDAPMEQVCRSDEAAAAVSRERVKPILLSGICNAPIDPDKMQKDYVDVNIKRMVVPDDTACVPTSSVYTSSNYFVVLREIANAIVKGTVWNKKARIVLEYDPQDAKMAIVTFMEPDAAHSRERDEI